MKTLETSTIATVATAAGLDLEATRTAVDAHDIGPSDFEAPHAGRIWGVVKAMLSAGKVPDVYAVEKQLPDVPRSVLVDALLAANIRPPGDQLAVLADTVQRRRIRKALSRVAVMAQDTTQGLASVVAEAQKALESVQARDIGSVTAEGDVLALCDHLEAVSRGDVQQVIPTGIPKLDEFVGGLQKTLTVIGSLPGVGKSALLASILRNLGGRGVKVGLFSLEDERSWVVKRIVADACAIPLFVLQTKPLSAGQRQRLDEGANGVFELMKSLVIDDRPALSTADVVAGARQMIVRHGVKALIIDHLGEIRLTRSDRHDLDISDALQQLRALATIYGVPVVVACHLKRRDGGAEDPKLSDFAFSAGVERMARVALALTRGAGADQLRVHVLKQTSGQSGVCVDLNFHALAGMVHNGEPS